MCFADRFPLLNRFCQAFLCDQLVTYVQQSLCDEAYDPVRVHDLRG